MTTISSSAGLAGVIAGQTVLSTVGQAGCGLTYRGYAIEDLAAHATFEEVAWLLLRGDLPTQRTLDEYRQRLQGLRELPSPQRPRNFRGRVADSPDHRQVPAPLNGDQCQRPRDGALGGLSPAW